MEESITQLETEVILRLHALIQLNGSIVKPGWFYVLSTVKQ